jgi:hypothetical protein
MELRWLGRTGEFGSGKWGRGIAGGSGKTRVWNGEVKAMNDCGTVERRRSDCSGGQAADRGDGGFYEEIRECRTEKVCGCRRNLADEEKRKSYCPGESSEDRMQLIGAGYGAKSGTGTLPQKLGHRLCSLGSGDDRGNRSRSGGDPLATRTTKNRRPGGVHPTVGHPRACGAQYVSDTTVRRPASSSRGRTQGRVATCTRVASGSRFVATLRFCQFYRSAIIIRFCQSRSGTTGVFHGR